MKNTKIGIIWIDEPASVGGKYNYVNSGWECKSSNPDEIGKVMLNQLDRQRTYITNIKPHKFSHLGLERFDNIRSSKFLGVFLSTIAVELNLPDDLAKKLPVMYSLCQMIATKLEQDYKVDLLADQFTVQKTLNLALLPEHQRERLMVDGAHSLELQRAVHESMQKLQGNSNRRVRARQSVASARFPRAPYALTLLNQIYPASNQYTESHELTSVEVGTTERGYLPNTENVVNRLKEIAKTQCGFVNIEQTQRWDKYHSQYPFGKEVLKADPRHWASIPEVIDLLNYSTLKLGKMFLTEGRPLDIAPAIPEAASVTFLSYVNGLINETIWASISHSENKDVHPSPIATYMRAYDRIMCRLKANAFIDDNFELCGFSTGVLRFFVEDTDTDEIARLQRKMTSLNLIPQLNLLR